VQTAQGLLSRKTAAEVRLEGGGEETKVLTTKAKDVPLHAMKALGGRGV
jgi:hypothetical protein